MSATSSPDNRDVLPPLDALASQHLAAKISRAGQPWLHNEVAARMAQRLAIIRKPVKHWVHWTPRIGGLASQTLIEPLFPQAHCSVVHPEPQDAVWASQALAPPWWKRWWGKHRHHGWTHTEPADMVWANMGLHVHPDPAGCMSQWSSSLNADGFVMFSCLGPDSLRELRDMYRQLGWPAPCHQFTDMHDWGDMLLEAGFAQPIMDMERITLTYESPQALLSELRTLGRNLNVDRFQTLKGRGWLQHLHLEMRHHLAVPAEGGRLGLTFEVIYGHAFKAPPRWGIQPETRVRLQDMKAQLKRG